MSSKRCRYSSASIDHTQGTSETGSGYGRMTYVGKHGPRGLKRVCHDARHGESGG